MESSHTAGSLNKPVVTFVFVQSKQSERERNFLQNILPQTEHMSADSCVFSEAKLCKHICTFYISLKTLPFPPQVNVKQ